MNLTLIPNVYLPSVGGLEIAVNNLSKQLLKKGHRLNIITLKYPFHLKSCELLEGVSVNRLRFLTRLETKGLDILNIRRSIKEIGLILCAVWRMWRLLKKYRPDIVNTHYTGPLVTIVLLLSYICKFKLVITLHGFNVHLLPLVSEGRGWVFRKILKRADYITACSQSLLIYAQRIVPEIKQKCRVIPNGVNLEEFKYREKYKYPNPYIFSLANFHDYKGLDILIICFQSVAEKYNNVDLIIAGDGFLREDYQRLADLLGLKNKVIFLGCVSDRGKIVELFNGCDFFVLPSRCEPFGIVNLEAMAAGKAIISTNNCGIPEVVKDGVNGILVSPKDDKALAEAIMRLLGDIDLRNKLGENGRKMVGQYSWNKVADSYLEIYEKILDGN